MDIRMDGDNLVITIPTNVRGYPSRSSGRNEVIATTSGFEEIPQTNMKLSLNLIRPIRR